MIASYTLPVCVILCNFSQEVEQQFPELVSVWGDGSDYRGIDYSRFSAVLLEGIKELNQKIENLELQLNSSGQIGSGEIGTRPIFETFIEKIKQTLVSLGLALENGIARVKELFAEKLTVGSPEKPKNNDTNKQYLNVTLKLNAWINSCEGKRGRFYF